MEWENGKDQSSPLPQSWSHRDYACYTSDPLILMTLFWLKMLLMMLMMCSKLSKTSATNCRLISWMSSAAAALLLSCDAFCQAAATARQHLFQPMN